MNEQKPNWYKTILSKSYTLAETFGLDDQRTEQLRDFIMQIAKDQYRAGNRSGIAWAFKQAREQQGGQLAG